MTLVKTHELDEASARQSSLDNLQTYCGLDSMITLEVREELARLHPGPHPIYDFERALQGPYLETMQRGFRVDQLARQVAITDLTARIASLEAQINEFARAIWSRDLNPRSPPQLREFFYTYMRLPKVWISQKGVRKLSTNREALEKLDVYLFARPFVDSILRTRDLTKQLEVFESEIDPDGRFRAGYNIAGTRDRTTKLLRQTLLELQGMLKTSRRVYAMFSSLTPDGNSP